MANPEDTQKFTWSRKHVNGFELSSDGNATGKLFSALRAKFKPGTMLGGIDISNMSIETVYQSIIKRSGKGLAPAPGSIVYGTFDSEQEAEDFSYTNGYLPLWTLWAQQNPAYIEKLRIEAKGRVLTDKFASTQVSQARALSDILNGDALEYTQEELQQYFPAAEKIALSDEALSAAVYTTGLYVRRGDGRNGHPDLKTLDEFLASIPDGVSVVVDTRGHIGRNALHLDADNIKRVLESRGIRYIHMPELHGDAPISKVNVPQTNPDGTPMLDSDGKQLFTTKNKPNEAYFLNGDPHKIDYRTVSSQTQYQDSINLIEGLVRSGRKVTLLGDTANPARDARALLVGKTLDRKGIKVYHQYGDEFLHQSDVVHKAILNGLIDGGTYKNISFASDGTPIPDPGVTIRSRGLNEPVQARMIEGNWNYGRPITIQENNKGDYESSIAKNADWADFTLFFGAKIRSLADRKGLKAVGRNSIAIGLPDDKEKLFDEEYIDKCVDRIRSAMSRSLARQLFSLNNGHIDLNAVKLNVFGADIAHITSRLEEKKSSEEDLLSLPSDFEYSRGFKVVEPTELTQEDINEFMSIILSRLNESELSFEHDEENHAYKIGEVRTNGQTGVAQATNIACQKLGITTSILAPKGFPMVLENETIDGQDYKDEAMFKNRFHQGLKNKLTTADLIEKLRRTEYIQEHMEDGITPGLSDRQILLLHELGYSNNSIHEMVHIAEEFKFVITDAELFHDFCVFCDGEADVSGAEFISVETIREKEAYVADLIKRSHDMGIGYITINNPLYPKTLRGLTYHSTDYKYERVDDLHLEAKAELSIEREPAIIWYTGDVENLSRKGLSLVSNKFSDEEAYRAAKNIGTQIAKEDLAAFVTLNENDSNGNVMTSAMSGAYSVIENDGTVVALTDQPINSKALQDATQNIVQNRGTVLSTQSIDEKPSTSRRVMHLLSTAISGTALVIDSISKENPTSPVLWVPSLASMVVYVAYLGAYRVTHRTAGNSELKDDQKTVSISPTGAGLDKVAELIHGNGGELVAQDAPELDDLTMQQPALGLDRALPEPELDQVRIDVLRSNTETIYFIPESQTSVREALRAKLGDNIRIEDSNRVKEFERKYNAGTIILPDGTEVETFKGYKGTTLQHSEVVHDTLYYVDGKIYNLFNAPDKTRGLASKSTRRKNIEMFSLLVQEAKNVQQRFQKEAGAETDAPIHFENALHLVIKDNSVEVRSGDEQRAIISLLPNGKVTVVETDPFADALEEHAHTTAKVFNTKVLGDLDIVTVRGLIEDIKTSLWDMDPGFNLKYELAAGDREKMNELEQRMENGFDTIPEENIRVAELDIITAQEHNRLATKTGVELTPAFSLPILVAMLNKSNAQYNAQLKTVQKELESLEKMISSFNPLDNISVEEKNETIQRRDALSEKRDALLNSQAKNINIKNRLIGGNVSARLIADRIGSVVLNINGEPVQIGSGVYRPERAAMLKSIVRNIYKTGSVDRNSLHENMNLELTQIDAYIKELQKLEVLSPTNERGVIALRYKSAASACNKITASSITSKDQEAALEEIQGIQSSIKESVDKIEKTNVVTDDDAAKRKSEELNRNTELEKADPTWIKGDAVNGIYIIERDGLQAYADMQMNIISDFYKEVKTPGKRYGAVTNESGEHNIYDFTDGSLVSPVWLSKIYQPSEGICAVKRADGMMNHLDISEKRLVSETWSPIVYDFHSGYAVIQAGEADGPENQGKYNYINRDGALISERWKEKCCNFSDNLTAVVIEDGIKKTINTEGKEVNRQMSVRYVESEGSYSQRTYENANADEVDCTIAIAVNFNTLGERCTKKAAGKKYLPIEIKDCSDFTVNVVAEKIARYFSNKGNQPIGLNIAGNGIFTLKESGISQNDIDLFVSKVMMSARSMGVNISSIRSGGQSGVDEAAIVAANVLDVPATIRAPKGYKYRDANNRDHVGKEEFTRRFSDKNLQNIINKVNVYMNQKNIQR